MCGIVGSIQYSNSSNPDLSESLLKLNKRGPDHQSQIQIDHVSLGHARLSIIDTSAAAHQPMVDVSGQFTIVFNGEIFNFRELKLELETKFQETFSTHSDTEVLLKLYKHYHTDFLNKLNGFWAFAIYDKANKTTFISRDRYGEKPLFYSALPDRFVFASELKALIPLGIEKKLDQYSIQLYFQLNYIPAPNSVFEGVKKLLPGHYILIKQGEFNISPYYSISKEQLTNSSTISYDDAKKKLHQLVEDAVERRMVADVPLGSFLSGGIDSSIVSGIAAQKVKHLNTFSIGFKDEPFFDETKYANLTAKHFNTNHTVFSLSNQDLFGNLHDVLEYIDEPFADSSALAVHILSMHTRKQVTVSLSGDGADEIFAGYNKHQASLKARDKGILNSTLSAIQPILQHLPQSRNSWLGNKIRQANRFAIGAKLTNAERYWRWCSISDDAYARNIQIQPLDQSIIKSRKKFYLSNISEIGNLNDELYTDMQLVLQNDMLVKVDSMSMANSLEVRAPFLDYTIIDFAFTLPVEYKIANGITKKILKDTFRSFLPEEIFHRPKHGFEVPLLKWFRTELKSMITDDLLSSSFIARQNLFSPQLISELKQKLFSNNPGEVHAQIWALIVFQYWWKKTMEE
ncbi:MAG: asparagine synthase (glutamine-hydrolyzing) [Bacteroidetes bacterium]|nr:asparagine synthase (glutamine-hydrolyzing) [Bacteroidota bacterium]